MGVHPHRRGWPDLAGILVFLVWFARRETPERKAFAGGIRFHSQRRGRTGGREGRCREGKSLMFQTPDVPADVGVFRRQIHDRPDLVVLPLLVALVS